MVEEAHFEISIPASCQWLGARRCPQRCPVAVPSAAPRDPTVVSLQFAATDVRLGVRSPNSRKQKLNARKQNLKVNPRTQKLRFNARSGWEDRGHGLLPRIGVESAAEHV